LRFTDEQPTVPVYAGFTPAETRQALKRKEEPSYQGTFTGVKPYLLHTFANTQSALTRKRVSQYLISSECPLCHGKRLRRDMLCCDKIQEFLRRFRRRLVGEVSGSSIPKDCRQ
jgi:excinuclease ABC subunit A